NEGAGVFVGIGAREVENVLPVAEPEHGDVAVRIVADLPGEGHRLADLDHEGLRGELLDERAGADEDRQGLLEELPAVVGDGQPEVEGPILQEGARDGGSSRKVLEMVWEAMVPRSVVCRIAFPSTSRTRERPPTVCQEMSTALRDPT